MTKYPLRFRIPDDEWAARVIDMARVVSEHPAFADCSSESVLSFLQAEIPSLMEVRLASSVTFDEDSAGRTGYTNHLFIIDCGLCCDLAIAAYKHFVLSHAVSPM